MCKKELTWPYITDNFRFMAPMMKLKLTNLVTGKGMVFNGVVDTGFDGELLLPWKTYETLELFKCEIPRKYWSIGVSVTGEEVYLRGSYVNIEINSELTGIAVAETYIHNERFLVGRGLLEKYVSKLDGPNKVFSLKLPVNIGKL